MTSTDNYQSCIYLDTNVLISGLIGDALSEVAQDWMDRQACAFAISEWTRAEVHSVIGLFRRKELLSAGQTRAALAEFSVRAEQHLLSLTVQDEAVALAAEWLRNPDCSFSTNDALHLAIAHLGGATSLATFDERFAKAAQKMRLPAPKIELIRATPRRVAQQRATNEAPRRVPSRSMQARATSAPVAPKRGPIRVKASRKA